MTNDNDSGCGYTSFQGSILNDAPEISRRDKAILAFKEAKDAFEKPETYVIVKRRKAPSNEIVHSTKEKSLAAAETTAEAWRLTTSNDLDIVIMLELKKAVSEVVFR